MPPENGQDVRASVEAAYRRSTRETSTPLSPWPRRTSSSRLRRGGGRDDLSWPCRRARLVGEDPGAFGDASWELLDVNAVEDRAVVHIRIAGTLGGVPVEQSMWQAVKAREGKVRWWALHRTEAEALDAVGLDE